MRGAIPELPTDALVAEVARVTGCLLDHYLGSTDEQPHGPDERAELHNRIFDGVKSLVDDQPLLPPQLAKQAIRTSEKQTKQEVKHGSYEFHAPEEVVAVFAEVLQPVWLKIRDASVPSAIAVNFYLNDPDEVRQRPEAGTRGPR